MLSGKNDQEKLVQLAGKNYKEQSVWFLNAFWNDFGQKEVDTIWNFHNIWVSLDSEKKAQGNELDELNAHRFLEQIHSTMTVRQMRDMLRDVGVAETKLKAIPLAHYLVARYKADWHKLVNAIQGDNQDEIEKAQKMLDSVQEAFKDAEAKAKEAQHREAEAKAARDALEKALADLKAQEDAYKKKTEELTKKTEEGGVVQRNKAKAELAQHLAEDPLPLSKAKLTTEAAHKKAEKATNEAQNARLAADKSVDEARKQVDEAEAYVRDVSNRTGSAKGTMWWMDKELQEAKKFLPQRKGGVGGVKAAPAGEAK